MTDNLTDPIAVAAALRYVAEDRGNAVVGYEPGNSTHYDLALVRLANRRHDLALICTNGGWMIALRRDAQFDAIAWCISRSVYPGDWAAIRPVLAALGRADGEKAFTPDRDALREEDLRAHGYDGEPINRDDAKLGRLVRRAVQRWRLQD